MRRLRPDHGIIRYIKYFEKSRCIYNLVNLYRINFIILDKILIKKVV